VSPSRRGTWISLVPCLLQVGGRQLPIPFSKPSVSAHSSAQLCPKLAVRGRVGRPGNDGRRKGRGRAPQILYAGARNLLLISHFPSSVQ